MRGVEFASFLPSSPRTAVNSALDATALRHSRRDMRAPTQRHRTGSDGLIDSNLQWWGGLGAMSVHVGWGFETLADGESNGHSTYYVRRMALRSVAYARRVTAARVEESWKGSWSWARRPFSLDGWGLHLASSGINNPNHHIGPGPCCLGRADTRNVHGVYDSGASPQSCPCVLVPAGDHVVTRVPIAISSLCSSINPPTCQGKHQGVLAPTKGKTPCQNLPVPSSG